MGLLGKGVVAGVLFAALAGCYSPDIRDCVVTCATPDDCAPDQVCGGDGLCASPEVAGRCDEVTAPDARDRPDASDRPDAREPDAEPPPPDATPMSTLRIVITGEGKVTVPAPVSDECRAYDGNGIVCNFPVEVGTILAVKEHDGHGWSFDAWAIYAPCLAATTDTCTVTVGTGTTAVGAIFVED